VAERGPYTVKQNMIIRDAIFSVNVPEKLLASKNIAITLTE